MVSGQWYPAGNLKCLDPGRGHRKTATAMPCSGPHAERTEEYKLLGKGTESGYEMTPEFGMFYLRHRRIHGDLIEFFKIMKGRSSRRLAKLFNLISEKGTQGNSTRVRRNHTRFKKMDRFKTVRRFHCRTGSKCEIRHAYYLTPIS